ncbi:MAG: ComEA family DNA-binding protein [Prolixibacteraceae bacterium]
MKTLPFLILLWIIQLNQICIAQDEKGSTQELIERIAETFADDYSEEIDLTPIVEDLESLIESPLNINQASRTDFEKLYFLNSFQIEELIKYRTQMGGIYSIYELQTIEGFTPEVLANMDPFIVFLPPDNESVNYLKQELNFRYVQKLEKAEIFPSDNSTTQENKGFKPAMLLKYRAQKGEKFKFGLTADHDSGEDFFSDTNIYGFDFYSAYFGYSGKKILKQVYLGDYQVKAGQGLIQWSSYGIRKSINATKIRQTGQGLRANSSSDENRFFRGAAVDLDLGQFELITYYSRLNSDANISNEDSLGHVTEVSSIQISGYHRTEGERHDEKALNIQVAGAHLIYRIKHLSLGINGSYQKYSVPLLLSDQRYNLFYFNGDQNYNLSTDFLWVQNRVNFFGEAAISQSGGKAVLAGMEAKPANELSFSLLYRNYATNFQSINGTSFSESSRNSNEKGIYSGLMLFPFKHLKISSYLDIYDTFWMKFTTNGPVHGNDWVMQADFTPNTQFSIYLRVKSENNSIKSSLDVPIKPDLNQQVKRARLHLDWQAHEKFQFRFRTECVQYTKADSSENGWLIFMDAIVHPIEKFSATTRLAWFNTTSYNSRIYSYENDVPQYFYIPAFYNKGLRYYVNCNYRLTESLSFYLKLSQLIYFDHSIIVGSASGASDVPNKTDFKVQVKYRF